MDGDDQRRRPRLRSFLLGGRGRRVSSPRRRAALRPKERKRETPAGLAAFEEAPCYRELVESERDAP